MVYRLETTPQFDKQLLKLGNSAAKRIVKWLLDNIDGTDDPRRSGKRLKHELKEYWRYRIGAYRVLARIDDARLFVLAVETGHRSKVYG
ncbi:MAG: type II toxin-antitoxin system RelE/ParE family toxin [Candidatus Margulisbacteria bacterium]|jgi:mRNA interferase RelE/StbE|nr:type II toxin-antitoxin system RelE/ParE family toxin [Candidatus Margulisiibacteriota bacterium]